MKVRSGLIQMALKGDTSMSPEEITKKMTEAHIPFIEEAGKKGVVVGREGRNAEKARLLAKRYFNISTVMINNQEMTQLEV